MLAAQRQQTLLVCDASTEDLVALPESHAKSTVESLNHFPNHIVKASQIMAKSIFQSEELAEAASAQLRLGPLRGPLGAAIRSALRASGIVEEGEYARELTKF